MPTFASLIQCKLPPLNLSSPPPPHTHTHIAPGELTALLWFAGTITIKQISMQGVTLSIMGPLQNVNLI